MIFCIGFALCALGLLVGAVDDSLWQVGLVIAAGFAMMVGSCLWLILPAIWRALP